MLAIFSTYLEYFAVKRSKGLIALSGFQMGLGKENCSVKENPTVEGVSSDNVRDLMTRRLFWSL